MRGPWLTFLLLALVTLCSGVSAAPPQRFADAGAGGWSSGTLGKNAPAASVGTSATANRGINKNPSIVVEDNLARQLASGGKRNFAIEFSARPDLSAARNMDWNARGRYVDEQLRAVAERSQSEAIDVLNARGVRFQSFHIKNVILVREGDLATMNSVLSLRGIERVRIPPKMGLIVPEQLGRANNDPLKAVAAEKTLGTNIQWVKADQAWAAGYTGAGSVVGVIDSGVRYDHEALVQQYRGNLGGSFNHNYSWLDPEGTTVVPTPASPAIDDQHGTHVAGTILGDDRDPIEAQRDRIGVAPDAKWIACQGFPATGSVDAALLACGEFMLAPTDLTGANPDASKRPLAVNNSWGACTAGALDDYYDDVVDSWLAAGIVPVFASGNASNCGYPAPPGLSTVGSPGSNPKVFTIGSTGNQNGQYATHSNQGPTEGSSDGLPDFPDHGGFPQLKPNVSAPGVSIRSSVGTTTTSYDSAGWTGTSMSTPHVTGLLALMYQAGDCLVGDYATAGSIIQQTATPIDYASGAVAGVVGPGPGNIPNFATGWGEINALAAVLAAEEACGPQGFVSGTVTVAGSGAPIAGALVEIFIDEAERIYTTTTDASGNYTRKVPVPESSADTYTVRASKYGFVGDSSAGVVVTEDNTTDVDLSLEAADAYTVSGAVTDSNTGWGLHARIDIAGYPNGPVWTDPATGAYSVELAEGVEYTFSVTSSIPGYPTASSSVGPLTADVTENFGLDGRTAACNAPGYGLGAEVLNETFEATGLPAGWTRSTLSADPQGGWIIGTALGGAFVPIPAHTRYIASNEDIIADEENDGSEDYLVTPPLNFTGVASPSLRFASYLFVNYGQTGKVQASINGGSTWVDIGVPASRTTATGWSNETFDLSPVGNNASVLIRFNTSDNGEWAGGWAVDDVKVIAGCGAPAQGSLVVGRVTDENTGAGLNGVTVAIDGGASTVTTASTDPAVGAGSYFLFTAPGSIDISANETAPIAGYGSDDATVTVVDGVNSEVDLVLPAGQLVFTPANGPAATLQLGQTVTRPFSVTNTGSLSVDYALLGEAVRQDFENGVPPTGWTSATGASGCGWEPNTVSGLPNYAGGQGLSATANSDVCGQGTTTDAILTSPAFDLSTADVAQLEFMLSFRPLGTSRFDVETSTDGGTTWATAFTQTTAASATGPGTKISVNLASLAGAYVAQFRFRYRGGWDWYAQVDQVRLLTDSSQVPWLGLGGVAGTLAIDEVDTYNVGFRGNQVAQPGVYTAGLSVQHNTPYVIPPLAATMTVTAPPSFGTLTGTVTSLGYCDAASPPTPVAGASVSIQSSSTVYQTTTDANGNYSYQLDSAQAPLTVTAAAPGHVSALASGIALSAGGTSDADLSLRVDQPCFDVLEASISATVEFGDTADRTINLTNTGARGVDPWQISIGGDPTTQVAARLTQSVSNVVLADNAVACATTGTNLTTDNSFIRFYSLAEEGLSGDATITGLTFGIESAVAGDGSGSQPVEVAFYTVEGEIEDLNYTLLGSQVFQVADGATVLNAELDTPITGVDPTARILVEVFSDDLGNTFFPGSNSSGETAPSYIFSAGCSITVPTTYEDIGFPQVQLILDLHVQAARPCGSGATPVGWLSVNPADGALAAGGSSPVVVTLDSGTLAPNTYQGSLCVASTDLGNPLTVVPATLIVEDGAPGVDLAVAVTESADPVQAGTTLSYTVSVDNEGTVAATDVSVTATLGAGLSYSGASGAGWTCNAAAGVVSCALAGGVAAAGSAVDLVINVTPLSAGSISTTFAVASAESDTDPANNEVTVTTTVTAAAAVDLTLSASATPASITAGDNFVFNANVTSVGTDPATGVEVAISLPAGVSYVSAAGAGWTCEAAASDVVCSLASTLTPGAAPALAVTLSTTAEATGTVSVSAVVSSTEADSNGGNNAASASVTVSAVVGDDIFSDGFED